MVSKTKVTGLVTDLDTQQRLIAGGSALALVAVALPWFSFGGVGPPVSGYELVTPWMFVAGWSFLFSPAMTVVLSLLGFGIVFGRGLDETTSKESIAVGVALAYVGLSYVKPGLVIGFGGVASSLFGTFVTPEIGVYLTILAGLAVLAGGVMEYTD